MASNLARAGFPLTVWNRTASRTEPLVRLGAKRAATPAQLAEEAEVVITMVSRPQDVEQVVLGPSGVLEGIPGGAVLIVMSTVLPATSRKLAGAVTTKRAEFLDAPVVGSKGPATEGKLVILVGGLPGTLERCRAILAAMGKTIIHAGGVGMGSTLKLATNLMLAHLAAGFAEGLLLVQRAGLDPQRYLEVLAASTFHSPWYQTKGLGIIKKDFAAHFALKHMRKDLRLMGELSADVHTTLPVTKAVEQLFDRSETGGFGEQDYSAIFAYLETASRT